jgi:hypothetical protein
MYTARAVLFLFLFFLFVARSSLVFGLGSTAGRELRVRMVARGGGGGGGGGKGGVLPRRNEKREGR